MASILSQSFHYEKHTPHSYPYPPSPALSAQRVFEVDADYKADYLVFEVDSEYKADLLVHKVDREYKAKYNKGLWFFTDRDYKADFEIFFVDREYKADLTVFFVDRDHKAGWRNDAKRLALEFPVLE
ncbi:DUF6150 family protein [Flagellimonas hadalis]|uniref:DUF6150 family protein n=1 Tax=Flagellimonas hadalis TaxID=2597517 RepID=UPI001CFF9FB0|nr:DUF6150 family protein [Allomuricauda hadalis]